MIVLHTTRYGDSSLIVHGYTRDGGRESFLLRGAAGTAAGRSRRHPTALLHPLSLLDVTVSGNPSGKLRCLREFTPQARLDTLRCDIRKSSVVMFVSEFLYRCLNEASPDPATYDFIQDAILRLEHTGGTCANFHIWFLIHFAETSGFPPVSGFDMEFNPFDEKERRMLESLAPLPYEEAMALPMNGSSRRALCRSLISYIGYHLGLRLTILSADVLHEIFA